MVKSINKNDLLELLRKNLPKLQADRYNDKNEKLKRFLKTQELYESVQIMLNNSNFSQDELYTYLTNISNSCERCGSVLTFCNFKLGFSKCVNCIKQLNTKKEIYEYMCENIHEYAQLLKSKNFKNHILYEKINYDFKDNEDLYLFLNDINKPKCRLDSCSNNARFKGFSSGYTQFCSINCNNKWLSVSRIGINNPIHNITPENRKKWGEKLSISIKERIKSGKWTPEITNSCCHSRYKIKFYRKNEEIVQNVRSSWEAFYQILNPDFLYEKLRIPYIYNGEYHTYIVDFINIEKKQVVEIKPKSEQLKEKNVTKYLALSKWCKDNNYQFIDINENYFKKLSWNEALLNEQPDKERLIKFKMYFNEN